MNKPYFESKDFDKDTVTAAIDEFGYVVLLNILSEIELAKLQQDLEPHFTSRANCQASFFGFNTKRIEGLLKKSPVTQTMALHPQVLALLDHVLGKNCRGGLRLSLTQGIRINPGEVAQILHPDSALYPLENKPYEFQLNAIWAYSDFTKDNGGTVIVPGSHKWAPDRVPQPHEMQYTEMPAGSVMIYAASLLHGGGENITKSARTGIAIAYCLGWLAPSECQTLTYPVEIAKTFPEELQKLIGYSIHRPNLGWVDGHDPIHLLKDESPKAKGAEDFLTPEQEEYLSDFRRNRALALTSHDLKSDKAA